jgi:hypothetical protein
MGAKAKVALFSAALSAVVLSLHGQQRQNDFTKRVRAFDGKLNVLSAKRLSSPGLSSNFNRRIPFKQIPQNYSRFGGKRFPMGDSAIKSQKLHQGKTLSFDRGFDKRSPLSGKSAVGGALSARAPAVASVEFRDSFYGALDKRVDEWMSNVNKMSLQDVNRYQFRRGRSTEPGFPVQKAGSKDLPTPSAGKGLGSGQFRGVTPPAPARTSAGQPSYRLGSVRTKTTVGGAASSSTSRRAVAPASPSSGSGSSPALRSLLFPSRNSGGSSSGLMPRLGPKKIRVNVK